MRDGKKIRPQQLVKVVAGILAVFFCFMVSSAAAQTDSELKEQNDQLKDQRNELESRAQVVQGQISAGQASLEELNTILDQLDQQVNRISSKVSAEEAKLTSAQREIQGIQDQAAVKSAEIEELEKRISDQAIAGYQLGDINERANVDPTSQIRMQELLETVTSTQVEDIERLNDLLVQLEQERALAKILEVRIERSKEQLEVDRAELEDAQSQQQAVVDQAEAALEARLAEAAVLQDRDSDLANQIQANTDELAQRAARRASSSRTSFNAPGAGEIVRVQGISVHVSIADNLDRLLNDARADGINLSGWGYRDSQRQIELRRQHCGTSEYAIWQMPSSRCSPPTARPGASQHERGLAIDFTLNGGSIGSRYNSGYKWLAANAARYGLYNLPSEPWHWSTTGN